MFDEIWKKNILKPSSKVGFWKPKTEIKTVQDKDEDGDCNKKLQEYANKIKNTPLPLKEAWDSKEFEIYRPHFEIEKIDLEATDEERFTLIRKEETSNRLWDKFNAYPGKISHRKRYRYNPIPEKVACKALELLETYSFTGIGIEEVIEDYEIWIDASDDAGWTFLQLLIYKLSDREWRNKKSAVDLELLRWESVANHSLPNEGRDFFIAAKYYLDIDWR
tara:strand:- start:161 stop:820 length:660 start_codon:yes stop_codon:yes gene_type:complete